MTRGTHKQGQRVERGNGFGPIAVDKFQAGITLRHPMSKQGSYVTML